MTTEELKQLFKEQLADVVSKYETERERVAFSSGILLVLSALKSKDGPSIPVQIVVMHAAVREYGEEQGWEVGRT